MDAPQWLSGLGPALTRRGMARADAERLVGELEDHVGDLTEVLRSKDKDAESAHAAALRHLGDPQQLMEEFMSEYRARTFAGRHPVWAFVVLPIPLLVLSHLGVGLLAALAGAAMLQWLDRNSAVMMCGAYGLYWVAVVAPYVLATALYCRMAWRSGRGWKWFCAACAQFALWANCFRADMVYSPEPGQSRITLGLGFSSALLQTLLAVAIAALFLARMERRRRAMQPV